MKKLACLGIALLLILGMTGAATASLVTIGTATYLGSDYNLIWDDDNNGNSVVWLDYTNAAADWSTQTSWATGLDSELTYNIDASYTVNWNDDDWRLPDAGVDPQVGYDQTSSEMGHLYYDELGLLSSPDGGFVTDADLNASEFNNLIASWYWSGTEYADNPDDVWYFSTYEGFLSHHTQGSNYGLAVRSGDVSAVPIPSTLILFGAGLAGLAGFRKTFKED